MDPVRGAPGTKPFGGGKNGGKKSAVQTFFESGLQLPMGPPLVAFEPARRVRCADGVFGAARAAAPVADTFRLTGLVTEAECAAARALIETSLEFRTTADSVDGRPTYEAPIYDRGVVRHPALCRVLEAALEVRAKPFLRRRFKHRRLELCNALVRRYLPDERREHPAHFDAHAAASLPAPIFFCGGGGGAAGKRSVSAVA